MNNTRDEIFIKAFGDRVREIRESKGMTQEQLGLTAGIGKNQVGLIERGEVNTTVSTIKALSDTLEVKPEEFLKF